MRSSSPPEARPAPTPAESGSASRPYFAYGSNMCRTQMARRCPESRLLGSACLEGWRFHINKCGVATLIPASDDVVFGLVWDLTEADEASLDRYEGVAEGEYVKIDLEIAGVGRAMMYLATDTDRGEPLPGYLEIILTGARMADIPSDYLTRLAGWAPAGA